MMYLFRKLLSKIARSLLAGLLLCSLAAAPAWAETKTVTAAGEYTMGEGETMLTAKGRALEQAQRSAVEQAGVYLESYTQTTNLAVTKDEITVLASGIVAVADKHYDDPKFVSAGGILFRVTITAKVDTGEITATRLAELRRRSQEKPVIDDYKRLQADFERINRENEQLKTELTAAKSDPDKKRIERRIADNERQFTARQWFDKALAMNAKDYDGQIEAYNQALALEPQYSGVYVARGIAYYFKGQVDRAIADYNQAITITPQFAGTYSWRGLAYAAKQQFDLAILDLTQAITINPQEIDAYNRRGVVYESMGNLDLAINDYNRSLAIKPQGNTYYNRGIAYQKKGLLDPAIEDYTSAISIDPQQYFLYFRRGNAYGEKGLLDLAIADFNQALSLNPRDADAYNDRGNAYAKKGQLNLAIADFNQASSLNPQDAAAYFNKALACEQAGRRGEAAEAYRRFIAVAPPQYAAQIAHARQRLAALGG